MIRRKLLLFIHEIPFTKPLDLAVNLHNTQPKTQYTMNRVTHQGDNIGVNSVSFITYSYR